MLKVYIVPSLIHEQLSEEKLVALSHTTLCTPPLRMTTDLGICCFYKLLRRFPKALQYHHTTSDCQEAIPKAQLRGCKRRM